MPHAPRCASFTSLYLRRDSQPCTSQCGMLRGTGLVSTSMASGVGAGGCGSTETGTEKDSTMRGSSSSPVGAFVVDIQRYMVGKIGVCVPVSSPPSSPYPSWPPPAVERSSAVASAFRFPLARDCFLRRRLIVSACETIRRATHEASHKDAHLLILQLLLRKIPPLPRSLLSLESHLPLRQLLLLTGILRLCC